MALCAYTTPEAEFAYDGIDPNMKEFIPSWDRCRYVNQGCGRISVDRSSLYSEGFSQCSALLIKDTSTLETALFHIDKWELSDRAEVTFEELMKKSISALTSNQRPAEELSARARTVIYHQAQPATRTRLKEDMERLNHNRTIKAQFLFGSESRIVRDFVKRDLLDYFAIDISKDIFVDSGRYHWGVFYNPENSDLFVDARSQKKVLKFKF